MILNKRYRRDIRHNLSLYVSATFLTVLSLMLFYLYYISGTGILDFKNQFFESQKVEDANFSTYMDISEDEIEEYEQKYDLELEAQHYINITTGKTTARVFEKTNKIDLYKVIEGEDVSKNDEVVISKGYANNYKIKIGDQIKIKDKKYTITGFIERPDYPYMLENLTDSYKNISTFFICYMTEDEFESLGEKTCQYLVRYQKDNNKEFRKDINDQYVMLNYVSAEENYRISMLEDQPEIFISMSYVILFTMPLITVILISVILSRKIKNEQKMIGTLSAYGYTKKQIIWHYAGFAALPGILGGVLTTVGVNFCVDPYGALGLMDYEPFNIDFHFKIPQMLMGIIIPTGMYVLSTIFTVSRILKNDVTVLLSGAAGGKEKLKKIFVGKDISFRRKFGMRSLVGNKGRTFALFLGIFVGSFIVFFSLADYDSMMNIGNSTKKNMELYNYQYFLNKIGGEDQYDGETILAAAVEDKEGDTLSLFGADENEMVGLKDTKGRRIQADDRYFITSLYAKIKDIKKGDKIKVTNPLSMESYEIEISEIVENNFAKAIYTSRKNVSKITGMDEDGYNMILSKEKLDLPEKDVRTMVSKAAVEEQYQAVLNQMNVVIYLLAGVGVIICIIAVYIAVNMLITENRRNISMLRVLGYDDKKIGKLLLSDNIFVVIVAIIVSIPCALWAGEVLFRSFVDTLGYIVEVYVKPSTYILSIGIVLLSYFVSVYLVSRKIKKVDMVECLKDNRE